MPLVEVGLPALALVVAVRNPRVPELHTLLAKLSITYRWCAEHCPAPATPEQFEGVWVLCPEPGRHLEPVHELVVSSPPLQRDT